MKMIKYSDKYGNTYYVDQATGQVYQSDGLGSIFTKIAGLFAKKEGGSRVGGLIRNTFGKKIGGSKFGNLKRSIFAKKEGGSVFGNSIRTLTEKFRAGEFLPSASGGGYSGGGNTYSNGINPLTNQGGSLNNPPAPKDNTMLYVAGGVVSLMVIGGIAYAVSKK